MKVVVEEGKEGTKGTNAILEMTNERKVRWQNKIKGGEKKIGRKKRVKGKYER